MKNDNPKYVIALVLFVLLFVGVYFWQKYRIAMSLIVSNPAAKPAGATIADNTIAGAVKDNYYPYGSGKIYFEERDPSTYKTAELLSFTPNMAARSAFKSLN